LPEKRERSEKAARTRVLGQVAEEGLGINDAVERRLQLAAFEKQHPLFAKERRPVGTLHRLEMRPVRCQGVSQRIGGGFRRFRLARVDHCYQQVLELREVGLERHGSLPPRQVWRKQAVGLGAESEMPRRVNDREARQRARGNADDGRVPSAAVDQPDEQGLETHHADVLPLRSGCLAGPPHVLRRSSAK